ncbi:putative zinc-binding metallopeptidase [Candidatus Kaiserbacteria bacterium]|nr:putative zinc-binding metallopeptidase [Candidatus Kaiserbacteria bacterium]
MRSRIVATIILSALLTSGSPQPVSAASRDVNASYRATLVALIDALQQQIAALQAELTARKKSIPTKTIQHDDVPYRMLRSYTIETSVSEVAIPNQTDEVFINRVLELTPLRYRPYLSDIEVFDGTARGSDAYVRGKKYSDGRFEWYFAVSDDFLKADVSNKVRDELIVHELGHIVSLSNALDPRVTHVCHEALADKESCPNPDSIYGQFVSAFWSTRMLDALSNHGDGFEVITLPTYSDWFVSRYASLHPAEDFAETFMVYVLGRGEEYDTDMTREKISFMDQFSTLRSVRQEILDSL